MRPNSIILFERLYLASLAIGLVNIVSSFDRTVAQFQANPAVAQLGWGGGTVMALSAFGIGISLLLWYFIARSPSAIAKWILVIFTALGLLGLPGQLASSGGMALALLVLVNLLQLAAVVMLFRADTKPWFAGEADTAD